MTQQQPGVIVLGSLTGSERAQVDTGGSQPSETTTGAIAGLAGPLFVPTSPLLTQAAATANTAAIQAALNGGNVVIISGIVPINASLIIGPALSSFLQGNGNWVWQNSIAGGNGAALVWMGSAAIPMVIHNVYFGGGVKNMHFIGDPNNQPSCAIQLNTETVAGVTVNEDNGIFENIWIGASYLGTHDQAVQFQDGIQIVGTSNGDTHSFRDIRIKGVSRYGVYCTNLSANIIKFDTVHINICQTAFRSNAGMSLANVYVGQSTGYSFISDGGNWDVTGLSVELSAAILQINPSSGGASYTSFVLNNAQFQVIAANIVANDYIVDVGTATNWLINITGLLLFYKQVGAPEALFNFANTSDGKLYGAYNIDVAAYLDSHTISVAQNIITGAPQEFSTFLQASGGLQTPQLVAYNTDSQTSATVLTASDLSGGENEVTLNLTGAITTAQNAQLPTVASLLASIVSAAGFKLRIINGAGTGSGVWTITTNTGWTLDGTMTLAASLGYRDFYVTFQSATTATLQSLGGGTITAI